MWQKVKAWVLPPVAVTQLGCAYCHNCAPKSESVEWREAESAPWCDDKCDDCRAVFGSLPLIEVEGEAFIEHFQCKIF